MRLLLRTLWWAAAVRQIVVLRSVASARAFLRTERPVEDSHSDASGLRCDVVLPVLREAPILRDAVLHLERIRGDHDLAIIVVTTAREEAERDRQPPAPDTVAVADELQAAGRVVHLHYPDPAGVKADQINFAVDHRWQSTSRAEARRSYLIVYDADSRPSSGSIEAFIAAAREDRETRVLHQSSRFEVRSRGTSALARAMAQAAALRANRFVLAYELPRLLARAGLRGRARRTLNQGVYTHVTGHGLCLRLDCAREIPLPRGSVLEDMRYSFRLGMLGECIHPLHCLDVVEVPPRVREQTLQSAAWFVGPARFSAYWREARGSGGWRRHLQAISAALITVEWLSCALGPALAAANLRSSSYSRLPATLFLGAYSVQLAAASETLGPQRWQDAVLGVVAYPAACVSFGLGGWVGLWRLLTKRPLTYKTARSASECSL